MCWSTPIGCASTGARTPRRARWKTRAYWCGLLGQPACAGSCTSASPTPRSDFTCHIFSGKAANEQSVIDSGLSYAILRPTLIFGREDILINNIAWILRRFPFFAQIGNGQYKLQPVFVEDLAEIACQAVYTQENAILNVTGPETFTFDELVGLIGGRSATPAHPAFPGRPGSAGRPPSQPVHRGCADHAGRSAGLDGRPAGFIRSAAWFDQAVRLVGSQPGDCRRCAMLRKLPGTINDPAFSDR